VETTDETLARALACYERGALPEAEQLFRQVLDTRPDHAETHYYLGLTLKRQGRLGEAVASFQQAIYSRPDFPEAYSELGASFQHSTHFRTDSAETYNDLGVPLFHQGRLDEALASFQQALRLKPHYAEAHLNMGTVLQAQGKLDEAVASFREAIRCRPGYAQAHSDLGAALHRLGKVHEALACFQEAVRYNPDHVDAHHNQALLWLLLGNLEQGWAEYEWRWRTRDFYEWLWQPRDFARRHFPQPAWDGGPLDGRTILLQTEQGLGDTFQFIRYASLVHERGGRAIIEGCPELRSLVGTCPGVERVLGADEPLPAFDVHAYLLSLPRLFGTTLATVPAKVPYLTADPALVAHWRQELSTFRGFKIGIVWQGSKVNKQDLVRSVTLAEFAPLAGLEGVHLFSLQKGAGTEQLSMLANRFAVTDLASLLETFMDTAAILMNLDLVIAVDTAVAHLAGALGVPVWVALPFTPDWRWLLGRADSPWYPTARLFRQIRSGDWPTVFTNMAAELVPRLL